MILFFFPIKNQVYIVSPPISMSDWCPDFYLCNNGWPKNVQEERNELTNSKSSVANEATPKVCVKIPENDFFPEKKEEDSRSDGTPQNISRISNGKKILREKKHELSAQTDLINALIKREVTNNNLYENKKLEYCTSFFPKIEGMDFHFFEYFTELEGRVFVCIKNGCEVKLFGHAEVIMHIQSGCSKDDGKRFFCPYFYCKKKYKQPKGLLYHLGVFHNEKK